MEAEQSSTSEIKVNGQTLETVTSFKYLDLVIIDEGSKPEMLSRRAQTTEALTKRSIDKVETTLE